MKSVAELSANITDMFQPELYLPAQAVAQKRHTPAESLAFAVLVQAIQDYQCYRMATAIKQRRLFCDAKDYLQSTDRSYTFSFVNVCELLNISPKTLRDGLFSNPNTPRVTHLTVAWGSNGEKRLWRDPKLPSKKGGYRYGNAA